MRRRTMVTRDHAGWLERYKSKNPHLLDDPEFANWLEEEYVPIAGGWQY